MHTVTSAELRQHFDPVREKALREPVAITHHGHESLVVMSAEEFRRLKALDTRRAFHPWELPEEWGDALARAEPAPECPP